MTSRGHPAEPASARQQRSPPQLGRTAAILSRGPPGTLGDPRPSGHPRGPQADSPDGEDPRSSPPFSRRRRTSRAAGDPHPLPCAAALVTAWMCGFAHHFLSARRWPMAIGPQPRCPQGRRAAAGRIFTSFSFSRFLPLPGVAQALVFSAGKSSAMLTGLRSSFGVQPGSWWGRWQQRIKKV